MQLYPYQEDAVHFIRSCAERHGAALLSDDMGVGKTASFLVAPPPGARVLISVPAALKLQTAERVVAWRGTSERVEVLDGVGSFRFPRPGETLILNPELLPTATREVRELEREIERAEGRDEDGELRLDLTARGDVVKLREKLARLEDRGLAGEMPEGLWIVADEGHEYGNNKSAQTKRLRGLVGPTVKRGGRVVCATATPVLNDPLELWGLLTTLGLHRAAFGDWHGFLAAFSGWKGRFGMTWREPRDERVAEGLRRIMLRRLFADACPNVPPMGRPEIVEVDLDADTKALADEVSARLADLWRASPDDLPSVDALRGREGKVTFEMLSRVAAALSIAKLPAVAAWADRMRAMGEPVFIADTNVELCRVLAKRARAASITGGETARERYETVKAFQSGALDLVAGTHRAAGVGVDLFRARFIGIVNPDWVPSWTRQSIARLLRQGQEREVVPVIFRAKHPLEQQRLEVIAPKKRLLRAVDAAAVPVGVAA